MGEERKCDECDERVLVTGPDYALCRIHYDEKDARDREVGNRRTEAEGVVAQTCPRRYELFQQGGDEGQDTWRYTRTNDYRTCSYCGSVHPNHFMEQARSGVPIGPTDKTYKAYLSVGKFYYQHLGDEQRDEFVALFNDGTLKTRRRKPDGTVAGNYETVEARRYWDGALPFFMRRSAPESPEGGGG